MSFSTTALTNERVLVRGTDVSGKDGETILDARQWNEIKARSSFEVATKDFDKAVEDFFRPIEEAQAKLDSALKRPEKDAVAYMVIREEEETVAGTPGIVIDLNHDSQVLRLIEEGRTNRLLWVGDNLEVTAAPAQAPAPAVADDTDL